MKKIIILGFAVLMYACPIFAQQAITTAGASNSKPQGSVVYSVGEIATSTYSTSTLNIHEGVIQDYISITNNIIFLELTIVCVIIKFQLF